MVLKHIASSAALVLFSATQALAQYRGGGWPTSGGSAPEIDGPAGMAAMAIVATVGLYLYNRYRR